MSSFARRMKRQFRLGATGTFPRGKLNEQDEGELRIAVSHANGLVRIDFGTPVSWFALPANEAKHLATILMEHANDENAEKPN